MLSVRASVLNKLRNARQEVSLIVCETEEERAHRLDLGYERLTNESND